MKRLKILFWLGGLLVSYLPAQPRWSFFCEVSGEQLLRMSQDSVLLTQLQAMDASLRVGLLDFGPARSEALRRLDQAGIPLRAWLLLSQEEGYGFHLGSAEAARERYEAFQAWTQRQNLRWQAVGLASGPSLREVQGWYQSPWRMAWQGYLRLFDDEAFLRSRSAYELLVDQIRDDGYLVESYIFPPMRDEQLAGTESLQRFMGIPQVEADLEVPMCYTSVPGLSPAFILSYGSDHEASVIGLGRTGGGRPLAQGQALPPLDWEALERDLLLAQQNNQEVVVFSLEGCLRQQWMPRLVDFDWQQMVSLYSGEINQAKNQRRYLRWVLLALDYPIASSVAVILLLIGLLFTLYSLLRGLLRRHARSQAR